MILLGDAAEILKTFVDGCIDLTVTSPPYDNLRTYGGYSLDFETIAKELYRVTKDSGAVVWIVGDATNDGTESLTSFKQAIRFKEIGFNIHDTMIYGKTGFSKPSINRYHQTFEYMFILSKGSQKTFNPIRDKMNSKAGFINPRSFRNTDGSTDKRPSQKWQVSPFGMRYNVWFYDTGNGNSYGEKGVLSEDQYLKVHPSIMPEQLAQDHIKSWSNEGDLILDPFAGSGTTLKAAQQLNRKWIGIEINPEYVQLAKKRLTPYVQQKRLDDYTNKLIINK